MESGLSIIHGIHLLFANVLVVSIFLPVMALSQPIDSESLMDHKAARLIERGRTFERYDLGNQTEQIVVGVEPWTWDSSQNRYVNHLVRQPRPGVIDIQSGLIGVSVETDRAVITDANMTEARANEVWDVYYGEELLLQIFKSQALDEHPGHVTIINSYDLEFPDGKPAGQMLLTYSLPDGKGMQRIVDINGIEDASEIRLVREWSAISGKAEIVQVEDFENTGDKTEVLNSTEKSHDITKDSSAPEVISFVSLDGEMVFNENLEPSKEYLQRISYKETEINFEYAGFVQANSLQLIDDTATISTGYDGRVDSPAGTGTSCPSGSKSVQASTSTTRIRLPTSSDSTNPCSLAFFEFDISVIPNTADITDVDIGFDISSVSSAGVCDIMPMASRPALSSDDAVWDDVIDGTPYSNADVVCQSTGDNKSIDLGTTADADLELRLTSGDWFAIGIKPDVMTRDSTLHQTVIETIESGSAVPTPTLTVTYQGIVVVPVQFGFRTGSDTLETAGVNATISCDGGVANHDGSPATVNVSCYASTTVTVTLPADASTSRFRFSDGTTSKQFTSCTSGTCSTTSYTDITRQFKITITPSGLDGNRNLSIQRTQVGSLGTDLIAGSTATGVWGDQSSSMVASDSLAVTSAQERFQSYNSTAQRTITISSASSKTYLFQHEYNTLFRILEANLGTELPATPAGSFSASITTANSSILAVTFNTPNTDNYLDSPSRYWVKNGSTSWGNLIWRSIIVNASGSQDINSYGNFDINSRTKHYGFDFTRNFRIGVEAGDILSGSISYDFTGKSLTFDAAATGTRDVRVEYPSAYLSQVLSVTVDGSPHSAQEWSFSDVGSGVGLVNINDIGFSTKTIVITFAEVVLGGGGGSSGGGSLFEILPDRSFGIAFATNIAVPTLTVEPGKPKVFNVTVYWSGTDTLIVENVTFSKHESWFVIQETFPKAFTRQLHNNGSMFATIPVILTVPQDVQGITEIMDVQVVSNSGRSTSTDVAPVRIIYTGQPVFAWLAVGGVLGVIIIGLAVGTVRGKRQGSWYRG